MPVVIQQSIAKASIVVLAHGEEDVGLGLGLVLSGDHQVVIGEPAKMRSSPAVWKGALEIFPIPVDGEGRRVAFRGGSRQPEDLVSFAAGLFVRMYDGNR